MEDILLNKIKELIKEQPKCEASDCYDDHGNYYEQGYYEGYVEALEIVLKIIEEI